MLPRSGYTESKCSELELDGASLYAYRDLHLIAIDAVWAVFSPGFKRLFHSLAIATGLVLVDRIVRPLATPFFYDVDLVALLMSAAAVFEFGGVVLGVLYIKPRKAEYLKFVSGKHRRGRILPFPLILILAWQ